MTINLSNTKSAVAARRYQLMNAEKCAQQKLDYLRSHKEQQKQWKKEWIEANYEYHAKYVRISNAIAKARAQGNTELAKQLIVERKLHQATLKNRKTMGRIVK